MRVGREEETRAFVKGVRSWEDILGGGCDLLVEWWKMVVEFGG